MQLSLITYNFYRRPSVYFISEEIIIRSLFSSYSFYKHRRRTKSIVIIIYNNIFFNSFSMSNNDKQVKDAINKVNVLSDAKEQLAAFQEIEKLRNILENRYGSEQKPNQEKNNSNTSEQSETKSTS